MKMDQHHDYSIDEHNACRIKHPQPGSAPYARAAYCSHTVVPLRSAGEGTGSRVIAVLALIAGMNVMAGAHAADCPHGTIVTAEDTVCTVPSGTGFVTVELWGAGGDLQREAETSVVLAVAAVALTAPAWSRLTPAVQLLSKVGRAGTGSVFQNVDGWKYGDNGGASTVTTALRGLRIPRRRQQKVGRAASCLRYRCPSP